MKQKGTYRQKVVKRFAPDAFVLIMENDYIQRSTDDELVYFNDDIENISIQGSVDAPVASASFTVNVPRKDRDKYFLNVVQNDNTHTTVQSKPIFELMMEVRIFIKGKYSVIDSDGDLNTPPPYQQFWGLITEVSDEYSGGSHKITVSCKDMLYWLQSQKMSLRPSILTGQSTGALTQPFAGTFANQNPKNIVATVVDWAFGGQRDGPNGRINGAFVPETLSSAVSISSGVSNNGFATGKLNKIDPNTFIQNQQNVLSTYWSSKFGLDDDEGLTNDAGVPGSFITLIIYGFNGILDPSRQPNSAGLQNPSTSSVTQVAGTTPVVSSIDVSSTQQESKYFKRAGFFLAQSAIANATKSGKTTTGTSSGTYFDSIISQANPFGQICNIDTLHTEYQSLLDVCVTCRDYIGYEFYMSLDGAVVFKPPFYNLDVKPYRPFVIKDVDIISYNFTETDDVITVYSMKGNISQQKPTDQNVQATGVAFDAKLAEQFGLRVQTSDSQMSAAVSPANQQANFLAMLAQNEMDRHNAKRFSGSITVVGTPEVKLGYPIYMEPFDTYAYVTGVSHSFNFGSSFQTTLTLTAFRRFSTLGADMVYTPSSSSGDTTLNAPRVGGTANLAAEASGAVAGSASQFDKPRVLAPATEAVNADNALQNGAVSPTQRVTDLDGYEVIGVLPYCVNLLLGITGNITVKTSQLNFNTEAFNGDSVLASQIANISPSSVNTATSEATVPPLPQVNSTQTGAAVGSIGVGSQ